MATETGHGKDWWSMNNVERAHVSALFGVVGSGLEDWCEAFGYAPFAIEDVAEVLAKVAGHYDHEDWLCVVRLKNGQFGCLSAGCEYGGWDDAGEGEGHVGDSLDDLLLAFVGEDRARRLEITLPVRAPVTSTG